MNKSGPTVLKKSKKSKAIKKGTNIGEIKRLSAPEISQAKKKNPKNFDPYYNIGQPFTKFESALDIPVRSIEGKMHRGIRDAFPGKKLYLIVNVASKCGLTKKNYAFLKKIHELYKGLGLEILAFPCN